MFPGFLLYSMELAAIDSICRVGSNSTCRYTANTTSIINHNFAKFCILRGNLTVIAVRISYVQFSITKSTVFIEYAIIQLYISNVATSCFDTSIFVYNKFTTSCIESPIRIYKEWHFAIGCGCTHGQIIFRIQSVSLNTINIDSYTTNFAALINGNLLVDCYSAILVKFYRGLVIRNSISSDIHICQFSPLICIDFIFCRNKASRFNSAIGSANAYILASDITKKKILIQAYFISLLPVLICFFYGNIATIDYFCMFPGFLLYSMELAAIDSICRVGSNSTCRYTANTTSIINHNFAKFCILRGNLAVVAVCIAYIQLAVTQCGIFIEYAIFQNYVADFAFGCGYFAVFIYNQFAVGSIECTVAVYKERYSSVFICSTYGQVVFCVQGIGLDGVYTGHVAFFIDSYLTKFSGFRSDLAVVAVCIAYIQLTVTQCGIFIEYAIFQNYVADFAFGCGYFAVFIYNQFAVGSIECAVAVYEERYSAVFICSTYGQVVFCVQCVGLNGVYINIIIQLNLNIGTIIADFNVLVTTNVNSFTGSYFRCFTAVSGQVPALVCVLCYFTNFLQLLFGCSLTFAVSKAIISSSCIAKSAYGCSSTIHNNVACCYTAACPNRAIAAADVYKSVIISGKTNIVIQSNIILHTAVFCLFRSYSNISTFGNNTVLACFFVYLLQLCHVDGIRIFSTCGNVSNLASDIVRRITHRNSSFCGSPSGFLSRRDGIRCKLSACSFFAVSYSIRYRTYSDSYSVLCFYRRTIPNSHRIICLNSIVISQRNHIFSIL